MLFSTQDRRPLLRPWEASREAAAGRGLLDALVKPPPPPGPPAAVVKEMPAMPAAVPCQFFVRIFGAATPAGG